MQRIELHVAPRDAYLEVRATGKYSLPDALEAFSRMAREAERLQRSRILLDMTGLAGDLPTMDRYQSGVHAANVLRGVRRMAVVGSRALRYTGFFEDTASNRGLEVRIFFERDEALAWLTSSAPG
jgi:hypothetical protein